MNWTTLGFTLLSVTISAFAQITLKLGVSLPVVQKAMASSVAMDIASALVFNPRIIAGFALYGLGAITWLFVLARVDVSQAYPFMGLGVIMSFLAGHFLLGEPVSLLRIAGMALVVSGVAIVAQS